MKVSELRDQLQAWLDSTGVDPPVHVLGQRTEAAYLEESESQGEKILLLCGKLLADGRLPWEGETDEQG